MKKWMYKEIVERPRTGGDGGKSIPIKGTKKNLQKMLKAEDSPLPKFESTAPGRQYGYDCKQLNEHLSPLIRFLRKNCGRPWDKVYGEICENIRLDSATQSHVRDHVDGYVATNCITIGKNIHDSTGLDLFHPFYVHPNTGLLCENKNRSRRWRKYTPKKPYLPGKDNDHIYQCVDDIWYEGELQPLPKIAYYDVMLHKGNGFKQVYISRSELTFHYGRPVYCAKKRQLNKKEIKKLGLRS